MQSIIKECIDIVCLQETHLREEEADRFLKTVFWGSVYHFYNSIEKSNDGYFKKNTLGDEGLYLRPRRSLYNLKRAIE